MIYAIGDVHGQLTMLRNLLDHLKSTVGLRNDDVLLFIGDYIDRGEDSCGVLETLLEIKQRRPNTVFLRGNHEQLMLDARESSPPEIGSGPGMFVLSDEMMLWLSNGGEETIVSYTSELDDELFTRWWEAIPESHWEFMRETRMEHISGRYHFVHAGLLPAGSTWDGADRGLDPRIWIREPFLSSTDDFSGRIVVFGHTPQNSGNPMLRKNKFGIDTGAVFGGPLTAVAIDPEFKGRRFPSPKIYQAEYVTTGSAAEID